MARFHSVPLEQVEAVSYTHLDVYKRQDLAPCFFDVYILKHHGYDFATWHMMDAGLAKEGGVWTVKGQPLRFVHFSGYGATIEHCMQEWAPDDLFLKELYGAYREEHEAADADYVSQTPWSYGCYASGEAVRTDIPVSYTHLDVYKRQHPGKNDPSAAR